MCPSPYPEPEHQVIASGDVSKPRVVYWGPQPSPYVVDRFNAVHDASRVQLEAWFDEVREGDRSWAVDSSNWRFPARLLSSTGGNAGKGRVPVAELRATRPDVLVMNYDRGHTAAGAVVGRAAARRLTYRCLPSFETWKARTPQGELAKHLLFRMADGAKVPGPAGTAYANRYGLPRGRTWRVAQAIDVDLYASSLALRHTERQAVRRELGIAENAVIFLYVGRLWKGKGLDYLLAAFDEVVKGHQDAWLLVVGDGVDEAAYKALGARISHVRFLGHIQARNMPPVFAASDVFVFPTLGDPNGLVVEEAMVAGLPVIATENAGDIRARVTDGKNGYVVRAFDAQSLAERMTRFAANPLLVGEMSAAAQSRADEVRLSRYAEDFAEFVFSVLEKPRRANPVAEAGRAIGSAVVQIWPARVVAPLVVPGTVRAV